jgi:hypothetical protein
MSHHSCSRQLSGIGVVLLWGLGLSACGASGSTYTSPSTLSKCTVSFDPPAGALPADGGKGAIPVKTDRECAWTAEPDAAWLSITAGRSGQGNGTVEFTAAANGDPVTRTGGIMLNGSRAAVSQAAAPCSFTLAESSASLPQAGGSGIVNLRASSELCTWTAQSDADWIAITSAASGKGSGTVSFTVAPATGPPRSGALTIAGLHYSINQSEGCTYAIAPATYAAGPAGGSNTVSVTAAPGCPWTAASDVSWITLATASGTGSGTVSFTVAATTGPPRTGTATIAGQAFTVTQAPGCAFDVSPLTHNVDASGGTRVVTVNTASGCVWTATSNASWITITGGAGGSGAGTVTFAVAPTAGPMRSATLTIGGQTVTVVQSQGCTYTASPDTQTIPASGGNGSVAVTAGAGCAWTASSGASWITVTSGASGSGSGTVAFTAASTTGPSRSGTIAIADRTVTVVQGNGCTFAIAPAGQSVPSGGGSGSFTVNAGSGCAWTATASAAWIAITSGASGTGAAPVQFTVAANTGAARIGTITAAGQTFTVTQDTGCSAVVAPATIGAPAAGGSHNVNVTTAAGCAWTAVSNVPWIAIAGSAAGSGDGTVQLDVQPNDGPARTGTATIAGTVVSVNQDTGCTVGIAPTSQMVAVGGGSGSVAVTAHAGCTWTAVSNVAWIAVTKGASGSGDGTVDFIVQANATGAARSGTVTIGGQLFTVQQPAA